jgi:uncharacterized protein YkwD
MHIYSGTIKAMMNPITNLLVLLIVTSMILPASAIMYASGSTENNDDSSGGSTDNGDNGDDSSSGGSTDNGDDSSSGGSTDNGDDSSSGGSTDNGDDSSSGGSTENNAASGSESTENNATSRSGFRESNDTGNAYCETCNNDIYNGTGDLKDMVLAVHNRERAAVGVPPLVWNDALAADAQDWANRQAANGTLKHCIETPGWEKIESCTHVEGENLAYRSGVPTTVPLAQMQQGWISEKNNYHGGPYDDTQFASQGVYGHYTAIVWRTTTDVGCATASGNNTDILSCRYTPPGNYNGALPY